MRTDQIEYASTSHQNILQATLTFWLYAETWLFFFDGYRIWAWLCGCCRSKKHYKVESIDLLEAHDLVIDLKDGLTTWSISLLSGFVKGPCKKYITQNIEIFDPLPPCHTLSPFALNPLPLVTPKWITNFELKWAEIF